MTPSATSQDWRALASALTDTLHLAAAPLAITFSAEPLAGVPMFDEAMPEPTAGTSPMGGGAAATSGEAAASTGAPGM